MRRLGIILAGLALAFPAFAQIREPTFDDEFLVEVSLDGRQNIIGEALVLSIDDTIYLPIRELAEIFELAITVTDDGKQASGFVRRESNPFVLFLNEGNATEAFAFDGDLFLEASTLEEAWNLTTTFARNDLFLHIETTDDALPIQERLALEQRRQNIQASSFRSLEDLTAEPRVIIPYDAFALPILDISLNTGIERKEGETGPAVDYGVAARGDLLWLDTQIAVFGNEDEPVDTLFLSAGRSFHGNPYLTDFRLFDVGTSRLPLISEPTPGRGVTLTNRPLGRVGLADLVTLEGYAPTGWDVELYRRGQLIASQRAEEPRYFFSDVQLLPGRNDLELRFYGPGGEQRTETVNYVSSNQLLRAGEIRYQIDAVDSEAPLVETDDINADKRLVLAEGLRALADFQLGLTRNLSLRAGGGLIPLEEENSRYYGLAGLNGYVGSWALGGNAAIDNTGGWAWESLANIGVLGTSLSLQHEEFQRGFVSDRADEGRSRLRRRSTVRWGASVPTPRNWPYISLATIGSWEQEVDGDQFYDLLGRVSAGRGRWLVAHTTDYSLNRLANEDTDLLNQSASISFSSNWWNTPLRLRANLDYALLPEKELTATSLSSTVNFSERDAFSIGGNYPLNDVGTATLFAVYNHNFDPLSLSLLADIDDEGDFFGGVGVNFALYKLPDSLPSLSSKDLSRYGSIDALAFLDRNNDGLFDPGEPRLDDVEFAINDRKSRVSSDETGKGLVTNLQSSNPIRIGVYEESLPDPYWQEAKRQGFSVTPRAGKIAQIHIPIVPTGAIEGEVTIVRDEAVRGAGNVTIEAVNAEGVTVSTGRSFVDGFYAIEDVPAGSYTVRISPEAAERLQIHAPDQHVTIGTNEYDEGDIVDNVNFRLERVGG